VNLVAAVPDDRERTATTNRAEKTANDSYKAGDE